MENANKLVFLGVTSFVLALTLNYIRKKRSQSPSDEKEVKKSDPVKSVTFGSSVEIIETTVVEQPEDNSVVEVAQKKVVEQQSGVQELSEVETIVQTKVVDEEQVLEDVESLVVDTEKDSIALKEIVSKLAEQVAAAEPKMAATEVANNNNNPSQELTKLVENLKLQEKSITNMDTTRATSERDSANNSPADFSTMNGSIHSDAHSEASADGNDSGKGGSDIHAPNGETDLLAVSPPSTPLITTERIVVFEFLLPQKLCGVLIGRYGSNVNDIKTRTGANLLIKKHPTQRKFKICAIEGTKTEIDSALEIIRDKFPVNKYPQVTLEQANIPATSAVALVPETLQLTLPPEVSCDVIVSNIVSTNHIFVQQPTHPTHPSLSRLDACMAACYSQLDAPEVVRPVQEHLICAAPAYGGWYRSRVISSEENGSEEVDISFVDYGGYTRLAASALKQIRVDFMSLPFQASECYLANIGPADESGLWSVESCAILEQLCQGWVLQAQVVGYAPQGTPLIYLYRTEGDEAVFINRELVNRGVARWFEVDEEENVIAKDKVE